MAASAVSVAASVGASLVVVTAPAVVATAAAAAADRVSGLDLLSMDIYACFTFGLVWTLYGLVRLIVWTFMKFLCGLVWLVVVDAYCYI